MSRFQTEKKCPKSGQKCPDFRHSTKRGYFALKGSYKYLYLLNGLAFLFQDLCPDLRQKKRPKTGRFRPDFRCCLKSGLFGNGTDFRRLLYVNLLLEEKGALVCF